MQRVLTLALAAAGTLAIATAAQAADTTINGSTSGFTSLGPNSGNVCNDGGGINNCYAEPNGTIVNGDPNVAGESPMIARIDATGNTASSTDISTMFPTIDGSEFTTLYDAVTNTLTFTYTPGAGDPTIHYLGISQANSYELFYDTSAITSATIVLSNYFPNNSGWSHLDVFDTGGAVPEPATWALMLLGFAGIGMALRRSRRRSDALMQVA
jgi:hypothetical protein